MKLKILPKKNSYQTFWVQIPLSRNTCHGGLILNIGTNHDELCDVRTFSLRRNNFDHGFSFGILVSKNFTLSRTQKTNAKCTLRFKIYNRFGEFWHQICQNLRRISLGKFLFVAKVLSSSRKVNRKLHLEGHRCLEPVFLREPWKHVSQYFGNKISM